MGVVEIPNGNQALLDAGPSMPPQGPGGPPQGDPGAGPATPVGQLGMQMIEAFMSEPSEDAKAELIGVGKAIQAVLSQGGGPEGAPAGPAGPGGGPPPGMGGQPPPVGM